MLCGNFTGERALFGLENEQIKNSVFYDGESPLKESRGITLENCIFKWKYPLWYAKNISVIGGALEADARAGIWYTDNISVRGTVIGAPKTFRRSSKITLSDVAMTNAAETLWECEHVSAERVTAKGDYFGMGLKDATFSELCLTGNYPFDGAQNITVKNSRLLSKDAFWNAENVTVENSFISGEYLAWNSKNLTFINCVIESHQGLCYSEGLRLENCTVLNTDLAFEYSTVTATLKGRLESVKNPKSGIIEAEAIGEIILDKSVIDPSKTQIRTVKP